jgi:Tfp pilus assembly protein PilO
MMRTLRSQTVWCARLQKVLWVAVVLVAASFYVLRYRPASAEISRLERETNEKRQELRDTEGRASTLQQVIEDVRRLRAALAAGKELPKQKNLPQFIMDVERNSQQAMLKEYSLVPEAAPARHDHFRQLPIKLRFKGDFSNVFAFLQQTEQLQRLTRVRRIDIKSIPNEPGQVNVDLWMNIYYSAEE